MSPPKKERIPSYLEDILQAADTLGQYVDKVIAEGLADALDDDQDQRTDVNALRDGIVRRLEIIGQALDNIKTADPEYAAKTNMDISGWYGLRSKISHGYDIVVYDILINTARKDVPDLVTQVRKLLEDHE